MAPQFFEDLPAVAFRHFLLHVIAFPVGIQGIPPKNLELRRLIGKVRLPGNDDGHQPVGVGEGDQAAGAVQVAGKILHVIVEGVVFEGRGE